MKAAFNSSYFEIASFFNTAAVGNDFRISSLVWRADEACDGSCYVAIKGEKFDGNSFIDEALQKGATLVITDSDIRCKAPSIRVKDSKEALCALSGKNIKKTRIIGVTGSVGKTTVKEMIKSVLSQRYSVICTRENENNEIGVAKTLFSINKEDFCIVEMGMRARGEIRFLSSVCKPETSIITNCGSAHIERLGSYEEIFKAKTEILEYTLKNCVLPSEERFFDAEKYSLCPLYIGNNGDFYPSGIRYDRGYSFNVIEKEIQKGRIFLPTISKHNITNSLFAYAVGSIYSLDHSEISRGLSKFKSIGLRERIEKIGGITVVIDCYNASYEGVKSSIEGFYSYCKDEGLIPVMVLGCMRETGDLGKEFHRMIGEYLKSLGVKHLIGYKRDSYGYLDGFNGGTVFNSKDEISRHLLSKYCEGYAILFKGSRSEKLEEIIIEMKEQLK